VAWHSRTWNWFGGAWHEGNPPLLGPRSHASWLASTVFDGARVFEGVMPDMDRHCARVNRSATTLGLEPTMEPGAIHELVREGARKFAADVALYVKPMYWAEADGAGTILPDPASTQFCLCIYEAPMPVPGGMSVMKSSYRRPTLESMPTDSKAGCLYPNNARVMREALAKGFDNALVCDALGNVAESGTANVFMAKSS
jgi:branched-chain amino acid aminotransferase